MDNFQRRTKKRHVSMDGFTNPRRGAGRPQPMNQRTVLRSSQFSSSNPLQNFKGSDGFMPAKQPLMSASEMPRNQLQGSPVGRRPRRGPDGQIDLSLPPGAAKPKKHRSKKKIALRSFAVFLVLVLALGGFLFGKGYLNLHKVFKGGAEGAAALQDNVDPSRLRGEGDGRVNVLLLGRGGEGHDGPDLTDTILIASIDPVQKQAALLSIPRDLWVTPNGYGGTKINAVFANAKYAALAKKASKQDADNAGFAAIEKEIQKDIGIPIHYHVMVDFSGFEQAVNTVGGIDVNIDAANTVQDHMYDESTHKPYFLNVQQGMQHFDGQRALFYARSRHTSARGDFDRSERQRIMIVALKDKVLSLGTFSNPLKMTQLIDNFGNHVQTNMSSVNELKRLYEIGKTINSGDIASVGLADPPNDYLITGMYGGQSIVRPKAGLTDFSEVQNFVRNKLKDGYIANENASIAVVNGTDISGLATKKAAELKSYGYNVVSVADAPKKGYQKTVIVDLRNGQKKYTKHYLEQRFGVGAVNSLPDNNIQNPGNADFVIILGQDVVH
jgi:LCP family protein required for cell wall assembly